MGLSGLVWKGHGGNGRSLRSVAVDPAERGLL